MKNRWFNHQYVIFDCDSTLSSIEGIDELAHKAGVSNQVKIMTDAAMAGEVELREVYGERVIAGALFDTHPRIVQVNDYHLDLDPVGTILIMLNHDKPGVIGQVGTILAKNNINIAQWRLGRTEKGAQALAFINLDSEPDTAILDDILANDAVIKAKVTRL